LDKVKVGVIGVGHLGRFHAMNYAKLEGAELIGVCDVDLDKANTVAKEFGCEAFGDSEALLEKVDAVSVAVPTDHHLFEGKRTLSHGVHCLMEKPIAQNLAEADELIQLAEKKNVIFQVGHVERFNPAMRALEDFHLKPQFIESHRLAPFNPRGTEVAVILDLMIHDIEIILHLVNSPVLSIDASGVAVVSETVDIANARIRFENGAVANLTASRISQKQMRKMRFFQKDAYVSVDFLDKVAEMFHLEDDGKQGIVLGEIGVGDRKRKIIYNKPSTPEAHGLEIELDVFVQTVQGKSPQAVTGKEGREALAVAIQVLEKIGDVSLSL